ncbi:shieldin complex subunit 3 [Heteronotia binoei]|uniref:shieldin complex subunit 3 n=1 Tax=Heteronotia binoei TaxID=13085 RepID=UPI00292EC53E|nr:shieldin complex subunit 3 [Heteronotia binoei]
MEVVLHYRPWQKDPTVLQKITEEALKEFPVRKLPSFRPWFPSHSCKLPFKPKRRPPVISAEEAEQVKHHLAVPETVCGSLIYDCTAVLLEFNSDIQAGQRIQAEYGKINSSSLGKQSENGSMKLRRSWSVSVPRSDLKDKILPLSRELQSILDNLKLHAFYRARWIIEPSTFNNQTLEDIWVKLNQMIKHNELPSCNATIQRHENQIWVFCDILYCEYVGSNLRKKLNLGGIMNLFVHRHGVIYSL